MRVAKWCGLTFLLLSFPGMCLGLMTYSFAGFPFGGASGVEEGRAGALRIIWISSSCFVIGAGVLVVRWQRNRNRKSQQAKSWPAESGAAESGAAADHARRD
jgi:hypothetical protein